MKKKKFIRITLMTTVIMGLLVVAVAAGEAPRMKMTTEIPKSITTPDRVETRIGTLEFFDGFPTEDTTQKCFDNLDLLRGVEAFLNGCPAASLVAMREGMRKLGAIDGTIAITESLMDSKSLFLTPNTESIYYWHVVGSEGRSDRCGEPAQYVRDRERLLVSLRGGLG